MKRFISSLLIVGSTLSIISIARYNERTNFCAKYDNGTVYSHVMKVMPTQAIRIGNLKGAIRARRAARAARVIGCIGSFNTYNLSLLR